VSRGFAKLLAHDGRLFYRYGIIAANGVVVALYALGLYLGGEAIPKQVIGFVIMTDPAVLGFTFLGGLMMLENSEQSRTALAITPLSAARYVAAKTIMLTAITLVAVVVLALFLHFEINWWLYLATVILTSIHYIALAAAIAPRFKTVTGFLVGATGILTPVIVPGVLAIFIALPTIFIALPAVSQFRLMMVALGTDPATPAEIAAMLAVSVMAAMGTLWFARRTLQIEFGTK
jgi:fluoroquinolone transport system permease protein